MGYFYKWVEGEDKAIEIMQKIAKTSMRPYRCEGYMHLNAITGDRRYLEDEKGEYREMWFLYYYDEFGGEICNIEEKRKQGYEYFRFGRLDYIPR